MDQQGGTLRDFFAWILGISRVVVNNGIVFVDYVNQLGSKA